jgi:hypothetical protein
MVNPVTSVNRTPLTMDNALGGVGRFYDTYFRRMAAPKPAIPFYSTSDPRATVTEFPVSTNLSVIVDYCRRNPDNYLAFLQQRLQTIKTTFNDPILHEAIDAVISNKGFLPAQVVQMNDAQLANFVFGLGTTETPTNTSLGYMASALLKQVQVRQEQISNQINRSTPVALCRGEKQATLQECKDRLIKALKSLKGTDNLQRALDSGITFPESWLLLTDFALATKIGATHMLNAKLTSGLTASSGLAKLLNTQKLLHKVEETLLAIQQNSLNQPNYFLRLFSKVLNPNSTLSLEEMFEFDPLNSRELILTTKAFNLLADVGRSASYNNTVRFTSSSTQGTSPKNLTDTTSSGPQTADGEPDFLKMSRTIRFTEAKRLPRLTPETTPALTEIARFINSGTDIAANLSQIRIQAGLESENPLIQFGFEFLQQNNTQIPPALLDLPNSEILARTVFNERHKESSSKKSTSNSKTIFASNCLRIQKL